MAGAGLRRACGVAVLAMLAGYGCMTRPPAPVSDRTHQPPAPVAGKSTPAPATSPAPAAGAREADSRPEFYTVKKGDTLYLIALDHGLDYKELAEWNNLENPNVIRLGQQLRLRAPASTVVTAPLKTAPKVEGRPVGSAPPPAVAGDAVKSQPKAVKVPYSDQALAQLSAPTQTKPVVPPVVTPPVAKADTRPDEKPAATEEDDEKIDWGWPASGKVLSTFNESTNLKGIGIAGKLGQAVIASAPGKVLYSGDGIRGYGKLVIIKHNKVYISVYAHNQQLLVKEGQSVVKGQKIADMGASDSDQVKLHFEIRRFGKPVDPLKLLPAERPS
jgi:lipoprotein NlpD